MTDAGLVLVTGGSGRIGAKLVQALGESGWRCRALVHRSPVAGCEEIVEGDLASPATLERAVEGVDAVLHAAALTHSRSVHRYHLVNAVGTANLAEVAAAAGRRFVFISTRAIAANGGAYSSSKLRAEEAVRSFGFGWTIVRLPEVYGVGSAEGVDRLITLARRSSWVPVVGRGEDVICPAHVDDVVAACVRALETPAAVGRIYTLAGPCLSVREFVAQAAAVFGTSAKPLPVPVPLVAALGVASRLVPLDLYPDQLARLRAPKPPLSPEAGPDLLFRSRSIREGLLDAL